MSQKEPESLPCPFCGSESLYDSTWSLDEGEVDALECSQCYAGAPTTVWNTPRTETPDLRTLDIKPNSYLVAKEVSEPFVDGLTRHLCENGPRNVMIIRLHNGQSLETVSEEDMEKSGWVKQPIATENTGGL